MKIINLKDLEIYEEIIYTLKWYKQVVGHMNANTTKERIIAEETLRIDNGKRAEKLLKEISEI